MQKLRNATAALIALTCSACGGGSGEGLDQNGRPIDPSNGSGALTANFKSIQDNVFTPICTVCHAGANAPRGLRLDATSSYDLLVGIASSEAPNILRVKAGDPNNSYLIQKLEGHAAVGAQMPLGGPPLPTATILMIRQWITDGAARPVSSSSEDERRSAQGISGTSVAQGILQQTLPSQLILGFDRQLDASLVNEVTVVLQRLVGSDVVEGVAVRAVLNPENPGVILINPRSALSAGEYRLTVHGLSGAIVLMDVSGRPLGRDYEFEFSLEVQ